MTTALQSPVSDFTTQCPPYCNLAPGHGIDNAGEDGPSFRIHGAPNFGPYIRAWAEEYVNEPGVLYVGVDLVVENEGEVLTPLNLQVLARHAQTAQAWLEARLGEPNTKLAAAR